MNQRENTLIAINGGIPEWFMEWSMGADLCLPMSIQPNERAEMGGKDWFGVEWTFVPTANSPMVTPETKRLTDITKWKEELIFPDLNLYNWEEAAAIDTAHFDRENKIPMIMDLNGIFERAHALMGFEDALMAMLEEPEACYELFGAIADHKIELHKKYAQYYKPEWITYHDDWGNTNNLFFAPETFRELIKPHTKRIVDNMKALGIIPQLHSHGKIEAIMDDIVEMGFKAVDPIEPVNDVLAIKEKYQGKICTIFGVDTQQVVDVPGVTEAEIREEVRKIIDFAVPNGGSMIIAASIHLSVMQIIVDEVNIYGKTVYK